MLSPVFLLLYFSKYKSLIPRVFMISMDTVSMCMKTHQFLSLYIELLLLNTVLSDSESMLVSLPGVLKGLLTYNTLEDQITTEQITHQLPASMASVRGLFTFPFLLWALHSPTSVLYSTHKQGSPAILYDTTVCRCMLCRLTFVHCTGFEHLCGLHIYK